MFPASTSSTWRMPKTARYASTMARPTPLRKTIDFGNDPDNMRYDEASKTVFVGFGQEDGSIAMIDPKTDERVGYPTKQPDHPSHFPGGNIRLTFS